MEVESSVILKPQILGEIVNPGSHHGSRHLNQRITLFQCHHIKVSHNERNNGVMFTGGGPLNSVFRSKFEPLHNGVCPPL